MNIFFLCSMMMLCCNVSGASHEQSSDLAFSRSAEQSARLPFLIVPIGTLTPAVHKVCSVVAEDVAFSGQFQVDIVPLAATPTKQDISGMAGKGCPLALFMSQPNKKSIEWRLYDTIQGGMIVGKRVNTTGTVASVAHAIADAVWVVLTGKKGLFLSKIAYCEDAQLPNGRVAKHICTTDYAGMHKRVLVNLPTIMVAPRWHATRPLVFYSEYTDHNIRLMAVDMQGNRNIVADADGITLLPAVSPDGTKFLYCASHGKGTCQIYQGDARSIQQLTNNEGNNIAPTFIGDGTAFYFCSDHETEKPQIYCYTFANQHIERITQGGYCASPEYAKATGKLVYAKMVHGIMQLFVYDPVKKTHTQITHDAGSKDECCWSPCGTYILFTVEYNGTSRLALLHTETNERRFITSEKTHCTYPAWSPSY